MDNPVQEITGVVHKLTQGSPAEQEQAINAYFTPNASFTHPFCRTGSWEGSRNLIHAIYRWYKILSPKIELNVNSVAYDETNLILYLNITQLFSLWMIPFHHANVTLTTELQLTRPPNTRKYYITAQNDLYQNDQLIRFFMPFGLGELAAHMWQYSSTMMCVLGSVLLAPATRLQQGLHEGRENGVGGFGGVEEEMRGLVEDAMEGVGIKKSSGGRRRRSTGGGANAGESGSGNGSASASGNGGVQQFGNMQVVS